MKTWTADNPKASLMKRKRDAIVAAAREAFLEGGYAKTSMDSIAATAGVSIKTVYRHFENKDDLFSAVMQAACKPRGFDEVEENEAVPQERSWFAKPPKVAFVAAGVEYLQHALSADQLALYRVVTQDAHLFAELGRQYRKEVLDGRNAVFASYMERWMKSEQWKVKDMQRAANVFGGLLKAGIFDDALHGLRQIEESEIQARARFAAESLLALLNERVL